MSSDKQDDAATADVQPGANYNKVGLTARNGTSTLYYIPADATLALDQGISPQWTSPHTFLGSINMGPSAAASLGLDGTSLRYRVASGAHEFCVGATVVASVQNLDGVAFDDIPDNALVDWATVKRYVNALLLPQPQVLIALQQNFAAADGTSPVTLAVHLKDARQTSSITFKEATGTLTFDPPSVTIDPGKTVPVKVTSLTPGAYFVSTDLGAVEPVEVDFLAAKPWPSTQSSEYPSTSEGSPTQLGIANEFYDLPDTGTVYYVKLPPANDQLFVSIALSSTGWALGDTLHFSTSSEDTVDKNDIPISLLGTDMTPAYTYVAAFYAKEKNLWSLYQSGQASFGQTGS